MVKLDATLKKNSEMSTNSKKQVFGNYKKKIYIYNYDPSLRLSTQF